ncbi:MAG: glycosyltransferase [Niabella sp.]
MYFTVANIIFYFLVLTSGLLIFYYLYFFSKLSFYKEDKSNTTSALPPLTVIVCARNEQYNLEKYIPHLLQQKYSNDYEVLLVNDNSEDNTRNVMQWMAREHAKLHIINIERRNKESVGKKYPLAIGISEAGHENILLTDADCAPASANWAAKMQHAYRPGVEIVLGYGAYEKHPGFLNKAIRFETFHSAMQYLSYAIAGLAYMGVGRNLSYKKELFFRHKGFVSINHVPGGDDDLFINKAATATNTAIMIDPDAFTISVPKKTWNDWKRQKTRHYSTSKYYKIKHKILLGLYSVSQFLFYPLLIAAAFMFNWQVVLAILAIKSAIQYVVFSNAMKKLNETDLTGWIFVIDLWMVGYYLFFANTLWKKEKKNW